MQLLERAMAMYPDAGYDRELREVTIYHIYPFLVVCRRVYLVVRIPFFGCFLSALHPHIAETKK